MTSYAFRDVQTGSQGYWRDVGTVDAYWASNLELIGVTPELNLYDDAWQFVFDDEDRRGMAVDSMVSGGCVVSGALVRHSLLFSNVRVNSYSTINDSVILPDVEIGRHCRGTVIGENPTEDAKRFHVTPNGVTLVVPEMLGQELHYVR